MPNLTHASWYRRLVLVVAAALLSTAIVTMAASESASLPPVTNFWTQMGPDLNGGSPGDYFGHEIAMSADGTTVAVAGLFIDLVRMFRYDGANWNQLGGDIPSAFNVFTGSGLALSADGNTVLIGEEAEGRAVPDDGSATGSAKVFRYDGGSWVQLGGNINGLPADHLGEGAAMSADGNTIVVGAPRYGTIAPGVTRVYTFGGASWLQVGSDIVGDFDTGNAGSEVAINADGTLIAVAEPQANAGVLTEGTTRVYQFNGTGWSQFGNDLNGSVAQSWSGSSLAMSDDGLTLVIGAPGPGYPVFDHPGSATVWAYKSGSWVQVGPPILGDSAEDGFGTAVDINANGTTIAVGAGRYLDNGGGDGYARMYQLIGGQWLQVGATINDGPPGATFAGSIAISADAGRMAVGFDHFANNVGRVRVFEVPTCDGKAGTIFMSEGHSGIGTSGPDVIIGSVTADLIDGRGGDDLICGGDGVDRIRGGVGNDVIFGEGGSDRIYGQSGDDTITAGSGADRVWAGSGNDVVFGGGGQDRLRGGPGNDTIQGNHQSDTIHGEDGDDILRGAKGKDTLYGGNFNDQLYGGDNSDTLDGGFGVDTLDGQRGRDTCSDPNGAAATTYIRC